VLVTPRGLKTEGIKPFLDAYLKAPERRKGTARLHDLPSFVAPREALQGRRLRALRRSEPEGAVALGGVRLPPRRREERPAFRRAPRRLRLPAQRGVAGLGRAEREALRAEGVRGVHREPDRRHRRAVRDQRVGERAREEARRQHRDAAAPPRALARPHGARGRGGHERREPLERRGADHVRHEARRRGRQAAHGAEPLPHQRPGVPLARLQAPLEGEGRQARGSSRASRRSAGSLGWPCAGLRP
jgi:hypothetical protein